MGLVRRVSLAGAAGLAAAGLAGCGGGGGLLSKPQASSLTGELTKISHALRSGNCQLAANEVARLQNQLSRMSGVNQTLLSNLTQGASTVATLTEHTCPAASAALNMSTMPQSNSRQAKPAIPPKAPATPVAPVATPPAVGGAAPPSVANPPAAAGGPAASGGGTAGGHGGSAGGGGRGTSGGGGGRVVRQPGSSQSGNTGAGGQKIPSVSNKPTGFGGATRQGATSSGGAGHKPGGH